MLKIGIIGAGRIGRVHAEGIRNSTNAYVKAIADPMMNESIKEWGSKLSIDTFYTDYQEILNDPDIDAVFVCSPTDLHAGISIEAIEAGKHVFCEKPISQDLGEINKVKEALEKTDLKFQVGFNRRFDHNYKAVRDAVEEGKIGDVQLVKVTARDPEIPPRGYVATSGGMFLDMTIHDFDMVCYLSGSKPVEVFAYGANLVDPSIGEEGDIDTAIISMKMENGSLAVIDNSRQAVYGYDQRAEVFGSKGQVNIANDAPSTAVIHTQEGISSEKPYYFFLERFMKSFTQEAEEFVDAILNDTEVPVDIEGGITPIVIAQAANKSMAEKRPVKISEIEL